MTIKDTKEATLSPESLENDTGVVEPEQPKKIRKTRTSKPKDGLSSTAQTGRKQKISSKQLTGLLLIGHGALAESVGVPELSIEEGEAEAIASALVDVLQFYDFDASAKTVAWCNLAGVLAMVYGVKLSSYFKKQKNISNENLNPFVGI